MGDGFADETDLIEDSKTILERTYSSASGDVNTTITETTWKPKSFFSSFGLLLWEQRSQRLWYSVLLLGCIGGGAANPLQAYLFAQIINVNTVARQYLAQASAHWALMFFILAIGMFVAYYILGWSSTSIAHHISCTYRQQYFESVLQKPIPFYDNEDKSVFPLRVWAQTRTMLTVRKVQVEPSLLVSQMILHNCSKCLGSYTSSILLSPDREHWIESWEPL